MTLTSSVAPSVEPLMPASRHSRAGVDTHSSAWRNELRAALAKSLVSARATTISLLDKIIKR